MVWSTTSSIPACLRSLPPPWKNRRIQQNSCSLIQSSNTVYSPHKNLFRQAYTAALSTRFLSLIHRNHEVFLRYSPPHEISFDCLHCRPLDSISIPHSQKPRSDRRIVVLSYLRFNGVFFFSDTVPAPSCDCRC